MRNIIRTMAHNLRDRIDLPVRNHPHADENSTEKAYNSPSPNEMVVDTDYVDMDTENEKEPVAIINPDTLGQDDVQPDENRLSATDEEAMKSLVLKPLIEEPKILEDHTFTWTVDNWRSRPKRERGPKFYAGGHPWRILLFPHGNNVDQCSIYLEHGYEPDEIPDNWSCCVQFGLILWNENDPTLFKDHAAHHRFTKDEGDWGFTRFVELRRMFNVPWTEGSAPLAENETAKITAYLRFVEDETGVLWHNFTNYDSKAETGFVGLKNQGATCYLNSLLQSLYFTNLFRKAVYEIPTENEQSMTNSAYTLQRLFYQLQTSDQAVWTNELTKSFGWETRHIFEQQDVQELSRKLMERLEEKMKGTRAENVLPDTFSGKIKTYISCINVDYESSRIEDFWDIQLNVSGNKTLLDSFQDYVQVEKLEGENQYFAGDEHKLQDADKGVIFTSFPDVLHLQLKRFEYDIMRDTMMKINDRYEFPDSFDASPYLSKDSEKKDEDWEYQLHGVLVHSGDLNAGHYYAFIKPEKDGWFYKYDDDKVTKATMREVLEENYGGEYRTPNSNTPLMNKKAPIMRQNSAYMLVYIRVSKLDKVLCPVSKTDAPQHLQQRFEEEILEKEVRRKEQKEAHLYMAAKVITNETFRNFGGTDLCSFEATAQTDDASPLHYRVLRAMRLTEFVGMIAEELKKDPKTLRLWTMVNRQNKTIRPDTPIMDLSGTVEDAFSRATVTREQTLRLWVEEAEEVNEQGEAVWHSYAASSPNGVVVKNDSILLLLKHFDVEKQTLRGVGHVYVGKDKKVEDLVPFINKKMGWKDESEDKLLLWEEIKPTMIEPLKPKMSLKGAELQDGDIVCFQQAPESKSDSPPLDPAPQSLDHFDDAREYYDYLEHKKVVKFLSHPTRNAVAPFDEFDLSLNSKITYDHVAVRVGKHLGVPPTHIRFWTINAATNNPKAPVRRGTNPSLRQILHPLGASTFSASQRSDSFFLEILDMSLEEFDTKKTIKVNWLSEGITKEDPVDVLVPKSGSVEDLIAALVKKLELPSEDEAGRIRIYETTSNKVYREPARHTAVLNLSEYTHIYAERVPPEEVDVDDNQFINAFQFQNEVNRTHGVPFRFLLVEGEKFADTKKRLEKRTGLKGKSFEKIKFAVVRRANYSKPQYLEDDDVLADVAASEDDYLGLDHLDRTRAVRNGGGDLFLR